MTTRGGRIPPDNRGPQAKGVGKNAKRHDLERPKTPGLHDSDLQQGDVQAMEQGQRIAPVKTQEPAVPQPPRGGGMAPVAPSGATGDPTNPTQIAARRLGGTLGREPRGAQFTEAEYEKARQWGMFFGAIAKNPKAPSGVRLRARQQQADLAQTYRGPRSSVMDMAQGDDDIEAFLEAEGF